MNLTYLPFKQTFRCKYLLRLLQYQDISLALLSNSYSSSCLFQAKGLKEGDYIVAVGDTDCKWMGVSEVMRLLKDVNEEGIDIQVVSMMDSNPPMVCHALLPYWLRE